MNDSKPMTVDEFYAFTDTRPDGEKWELIEGQPVLNASPLDVHQLIVQNIVFFLMAWRREAGASWAVLWDFGVRISERSRPEPDVLVYPSRHGRPEGRRDRNDALVIFEVLSPSTENGDLGWKFKAYTGLASLTRYVVISQDAVTSRYLPVMTASRDAGCAPWMR